MAANVNVSLYKRPPVCFVGQERKMQVRSNWFRRAHTVWVFSMLVAVIHLGPNKFDSSSHQHIFILAEAQQPLHNQHHHVAAVTPPEAVASSSTDSCLDNEIRMAMSEKIASAGGFLAALDQSGGSSPNALRAYGVPDDAYVVGEESMYDRIHEMRTRIMTSPSFTGDQVLGAILFEQTMDRTVNGMKTAQYLWQVKHVVPFLKIDQGLAAYDEATGVQLMKQPIPQLNELLQRAVEHGIYGTKMRSVIKRANANGIKAIVEQQFELGKQIIAAGLVPILEPEVDITSPEKRECEDVLKRELLQHLDQLAPHERVILKVSLPSVVNHYQECIHHPRVIRVVALSGGYSRDEANAILSQQTGMIASFSRALCEDLAYGQTNDEFDEALSRAITAIYTASKAS